MSGSEVEVDNAIINESWRHLWVNGCFPQTSFKAPEEGISDKVGIYERFVLSQNGLYWHWWGRMRDLKTAVTSSSSRSVSRFGLFVMFVQTRTCGRIGLIQEELLWEILEKIILICAFESPLICIGYIVHTVSQERCQCIVKTKTKNQAAGFPWHDKNALKGRSLLCRRAIIVLVRSIIIFWCQNQRWWERKLNIHNSPYLACATEQVKGINRVLW